MREFFWPGSQVNRLVKKFSIYWREKKTMYDPVILMGLGKGKKWGH